MQKIIGRNDFCWCGSGIKYKNCHRNIEDKISLYASKGYEVPDYKLIKNNAQIEGMRKSGMINTRILDYIGKFVARGVDTEKLDRIVYERTKEFGGTPAPLNYNGFPKSCCISINEVVCHGIPSKTRILKAGDIVNIDISTIFEGYFSDSSRMFCVGEVSAENKRLVEVARECMEIGVKEVKPWIKLGDIGAVINEYAIKNGYSVVRDIGGHGVGLEFHEDPFVSYVAKKDTGVLLVPGMVFTIEPMVNMGKADVYQDDEDGWTIYTDDGKPSAQWECTVCVTEDGHEILAN